MKKGFYLKFATNSIKKNRQLALPYTICLAVMCAVFYIITSLAMNKTVSGFKGALTILVCLNLGIYVIGFFSVIILFYANNFMLKHRKSEFGLYNVLGMEKRHIFRMVAIENILEGFVGMAVGIISGLVFNKAVFMLLANMLGEDSKIGFQIPVRAVVTTVILFIIIIFINILNGLRQIGFSNTIELLKSSDAGEKEPKSKWLIAIIGAIFLGAGYAISVSIQNPIKAMLYFFVAVICVIIGTYFLFTAGSIVLLKILRKNKKYYYKTKHFISVSGMMYRMKQNAASLASICILSTMVLVTISSTVTLYTGTGDMLKKIYPRDMNLYVYQILHEDSSFTEQNKANVDIPKKILLDICDEEKISYNDEFLINYGTYISKIDNNKITFATRDVVNDADVLEVFVLTQDEFNKICNKSIQLSDGEVFIYDKKGNVNSGNISINGINYKIKGITKSITEEWDMDMLFVDNIIVAVKDMDEMLKIDASYKKDENTALTPIKSFYGVNLNDTSKNEIITDKFETKYEECIDNMPEGNNTETMWTDLRNREEMKDEYISVFSGLFFIGIFLGIVFLVSTIMIIYYKQVSEGYQDRRRFEIMEKVGLTKQEVKKSIHSQILTVFFLPLITAGIHTAFAFPIISKSIKLFGMTNTGLYAMCDIASFVIFGIVYAIVYMITSKTYYKIVSGK